MVTQHHAMNDFVALDYATVWERVRAGDKLSAVKDGVHLFSFRLRPSSSSTPPSLTVLIGSAYLVAAQWKPEHQRLVPPPAKFKQAPLEAIERRMVMRLFDDHLLRGRVPPEYALVSRDPFDAENERAYEAAQPDLYRYVIDKGYVSYLYPIRNVGRPSPAQETILRRWMASDARKGFRVVPSTPVAPPPAVDDVVARKIEEQKRVLREISRREDEEAERRRAKREIDDDIPF